MIFSENRCTLFGIMLQAKSQTAGFETARSPRLDGYRGIFQISS